MSSSSLHQQFTKSNQTHPSNQTQDDLILSSETIEFAHKMFDAARSGNLNLLKSAIESGLPVDLTNSSGNTLLMLSSYSGHLELVNYLISKGSNPNRLNDLHQSPLSGSVFKDHRSIIHSLFQAGADPKLGQPNAIDCAYMYS
ncbi:ankyrin repeat-containing domain protein [Melampsora americana]|nr:ankyrin repeat-containing domain protein [Melampsora americana]